MPKQLECRVVLTHRDDGKFDMGMYDPVNCRYEALGTHRNADKDKVVRDLRDAIERAGHRVSFSETYGKR